MSELFSCPTVTAGMGFPCGSGHGWRVRYRADAGRVDLQVGTGISVMLRVARRTRGNPGRTPRVCVSGPYRYPSRTVAEQGCGQPARRAAAAVPAGPGPQRDGVPEPGESRTAPGPVVLPVNGWPHDAKGGEPGRGQGRAGPGGQRGHQACRASLHEDPAGGAAAVVRARLEAGIRAGLLRIRLRRKGSHAVRGLECTCCPGCCCAAKAQT